MKIHFFKDETDLCERESCTFENADLVKLKKSPKWLYYTVLSITVITLILVLLTGDFIHYSNLIMVEVIALLHLLIHETCHILHCLLTGRKVDRLCLFPYGLLTVEKPSAYVLPEFSVWKKRSRLMFTLFPFIILSAIPALLSVFIPDARFVLLVIAAFNFVSSSLDICDAFRILKYPKNTLLFRSFALLPNSDKPVIIHRIWISEDKRTIYHKQYKCINFKLTEITPAENTEKVSMIKDEFKKQFNI